MPWLLTKKYMRCKEKLACKTRQRFVCFGHFSVVIAFALAAVRGVGLISSVNEAENRAFGHCISPNSGSKK